MFWNADKTHVDKQTFIDRIKDVMKEEQWVIDGNYSSSIELRMQECDTIFFLDYPLEVCLEGKRSRRGKQRPDIPWVESEYDEQDEYIEYVRNYGIQNNQDLLRLFLKYNDKNIHIFRNRDEAAKFLQNL